MVKVYWKRWADIPPVLQGGLVWAFLYGKPFTGLHHALAEVWLERAEFGPAVFAYREVWRWIFDALRLAFPDESDQHLYKGIGIFLSLDEARMSKAKTGKDSAQASNSPSPNWKAFSDPAPGLGYYRAAEVLLESGRPISWPMPRLPPNLSADPTQQAGPAYAVGPWVIQKQWRFDPKKDAWCPVVTVGTLDGDVTREGQINLKAAGHPVIGPPLLRSPASPEGLIPHPADQAKLLPLKSWYFPDALAHTVDFEPWISHVKTMNGIS